MLERPFWQDTVQFPPLDATRPLPAKVDVLIVGGGYTGMAAARELARDGTNVIVLEQHTFGWGASSRNGGMVLTGTKLSASALLRKYGLQAAKDLWRGSMDAIAYVEALVRDENITCDFRRWGHLELAWKPGHFEHYQHEAELLNQTFRHPVTLINKADLGQEIGSDVYYGGLLDTASAGLNPAQYAAGLMRATIKAGAALFDQTAVQGIRNQTAGATHRFRVSTSRGEVEANDVLIATNGYTGPATPTLQRKIIPVGSYIIATEPLPDALAAELIPHRRMVYDSKNFLYYWRLSADNRMIFGGRASFVPETPNTVRESAAILQRGMVEVHPQLAQAKIDYAWGGTLGFTFDLLPHAGQTRAGLHYALGCGGHGVAMLSHLGACMALKMAGKASDNPIFNLPTPGAPLGLYNGTPWFLPLAGAYYHLQDRLAK